MKTLILGFLFSLFISPTFGKSDFSQKWVTTPLVKRATANGEIQSKILLRKVTVGQTTFTVGNITYFKIPKSKNKTNDPIATVAQQIKKAMGFSVWKERRQNAAYVYETEWQGRFVRIYLRDFVDSYSYSVAMIRMPYATKAALEAELLQRGLAGVLIKKNEWIEKMITSVKSVFIHNAIAENNCASNPMACISDASNESVEELEQQIGDAGTSAGSGSNSGNTLLGAVMGDDAENVGRLSDEMRKTNEAVKDATKLGNDFQKESESWRKVAKKTSNQVDQGLEIADRGMTAIEFLLDWKNVSLLVGSSVATGGLASIAVSTAADVIVGGGTVLLEVLKEAITHEKEDAAVLERFQKAREIWEQRKTAARQFETLIDSLVSLRTLEKQSGKSREELLIELQAMIEVNKDKIDSLKAERKKASEENDLVCAMEKAKEQVKLEQWVKELGTVVGLMEKAPGDEQICEQIRNEVKRLVQSEADLEEARSAILAGRYMWQEQYNAKRLQVFEGFERAKNKREEVINLQKKQATFEGNQSQGIVEKDKSQTIDECVRNKATGLQQVPLIGPLLSFELRSECKARFDVTLGRASKLMQENAKSSKEKRVQMADVDLREQGKTDVLLQSNAKLAASEVQAYNEWFEEIENEQKCLNSLARCPDQSVANRLKRLMGTQGKIKQLCSLAD